MNKQIIAEKVAKIMSFKEGYICEVRPVTKNNGVTLAGIIVKKTIYDQVAPVVYVDDEMAAHVRDSSDIDALAIMFVRAIKESEMQNPYISSDSIYDVMRNKTEVLSRVKIRLVNAKKNKDNRLVKKQVSDDLIATFGVDVSDILGESSGSILIPKEVLDITEVTVDELYDAAIRNMSMSGIFCQDVYSFVASMTGENLDDADVPMYAVSNKAMNYGASVILIPEVQETLKEELGDFVIIPSSVHEVIAIPVNVMDKKEIAAMIQEVNRSCVVNQDYLSDHCYKIKDGMLVAA